MRSSFVVSTAPLFDNHSGLGQTSKNFSVQIFPAKGAVETFIAAILPRLAGLDIRQFDTVAFHLRRGVLGRRRTAALWGDNAGSR